MGDSQQQVSLSEPLTSRDASVWRFQVLGHFRAWYEGELQPDNVWGRRKTETLLKVLLSDRGRVFTQDELIEILFADLDPDKAISNLQARISELRRVLQPNLSRNQASSYIQTVGGVNYRFRLSAPITIDALEAQSLFDKAKLSFQNEEWEKARELYQSAFGRIAGEYLPEHRYEDWTNGFRARWQATLASAHFNFAGCNARSGDYASALNSVQEILKLDPYRERAFRESMLYSYLLGERNEALLIYQRCAQILRTDLGVLPSAETRSLYERIRKQEGLDLEALSAESSTPSIAVLPLAPLIEDPKGEYFSDGLTEDIIAQLSKIQGLKVISRTSVMRLKSTSSSIKEIGRELDVSTILEGSVRWSDEKVRVVVQLIGTDTEELLWTETYDRELRDIFAIQSELARAIAKALQARISPSLHPLAALPPTESLEAYQFYLKGRFFVNKRTESDFIKAIELFTRASEMDSDYAAPLAGLADAYGLLAWFGFASMDENYPKSRQYAERALELDGTLAEAHTSIAYEQLNYEWDWQASERSFMRAIEFNPNYVPARHWYAELLAILGRFEAALAQAETAVELDPLAPLSHAIRGWILFFDRQFDLAAQSCQTALELDPYFNTAHWILGQVHLQRGRYDDAIDCFNSTTEYSSAHPSVLALKGYAHARLGETQETTKLMEQVEQMQTDGSPVPVAMAVLNTGLHEYDKAVAWLLKAHETGKWYVPFLGVEPIFAELHDHPGFRSVLERLDLKILHG